MKQILFILCALPSLAIAQNKNPYAYFKVENNAAVFESVYDTTVSQAQLKQLLLQMAMNLPHAINVQSNENTITGAVNGATYPHKQYGMAGMQTTAWFLYPVSFNFIIDVRDNKYRVKITSIAFDTKDLHSNIIGSSQSLENALFRNNKFDWRTSARSVENNTAFEHWLFDLFWVHPLNNDNW